MTAAHIPPSDVIVATTWQTALSLAPFPLSHGRQYYLVQHDEGLYHGDRGAVNRALRLPQRKIVVSTWLGNILKDSHHQDASVLINPIDTNLFHKMPRTASTDTVRILLLHHTYSWKGTAEGAAIIEKMKKRYPEVRFILFGVRSKGNVPYAYDEYHYDLPQENLASLYSNTDIYLCPSWEEGFGLPSVEAMHCGAALVTYDNGGSRDYAIDGETAFVAPHRDIEALATKLETAITDVALRKRIAEQGKTFVQNMPTWAEQTERFEHILADKT
jgi:glycosyltransferase involved in cell wall biosynthesis